LELFCEPISCYNFMAGCGDDLKHLLWEMEIMLTRNRVFMLFGTAVLFAGCGVLFWANQKKDLGHYTDITLINPGVLEGYVQDIRNGILQVQMKLELDSFVLVKKLIFL